MRTTFRPSQTPAVRRPAVAGRFYPDDAVMLRTMVGDFLAAGKRLPTGVPKAVIAPHAGYRYSGPVAGSAYACLAHGRESIQRVVLLGPSHFMEFSGMAASSADRFESPIGPVFVDATAAGWLRGAPQITTLDAAHAPEHSLEAQLPFLQIALEDFKLVPLLVGEATANAVEEVLNRLWGGPETCIVVSSDLSHYHDDQAARHIDRETAQAIERLDDKALDGERACGWRAIGGLLRAARAHGLDGRTVDLRNSGETSGRRDRVVGYGAFVFTDRALQWPARPW